MSQFEYVTVFISILLAFAITELLAGLGRLIRERDHVRIYWVHVAWMLIAILAVTQAWWVIWNMRRYELGSFFEFLALVVPRLVFVVIAFLLSPPIGPGQSFDLRDYYFRHIRWIAWLFAPYLLGIAFARSAFGLEPLLNPINGVRIVVVGFIASLGFTRSPRIHETAVFVVGALFALAIAIVFLHSSS